MLKRSIIAALATVALVGLGARLTAYVISTEKWASSQVPFFVNPVNADISEDAAIAALRSAAANWSTQTTANVTVYYVGRTTGTSLTNNGKNEIFFRNGTSGSTIAAAYYWYDGTNKIVDADMIFYDAAYKFFTGQSGCASGFYVEDIATHEFGHFIGIYHSADATATMYPTQSSWCNQSWRFLAQDDINAVVALYPPATATAPPAAPSSAAARLAVTNPYVDVNWVDASTNESGFRVERSSDGVTFTQVGQTGASVVAFQDRTTTGGKTYWYRVRAYNSGGTSATSNTVSISVPLLQAPSAPVLSSPANGITTSANTASWLAAARATSYDVYLGTSATPALYKQNVTGTSVTLRKLVKDSVYYWRVVAKNSSGSATSATWSFRKR
jgi:Matrixin